MAKSSVVSRLYSDGIACPPRWLPDNVHLEVLHGSIAYGYANNTSDRDIYGICIPPKDLIFPHLAGNIPGFGRQILHFEQYIQHGLHDPHDPQDRTIDLTIMSIVKFFQLAMDNNPNILDLLFAPHHCILHITRVGQMIREKRKMFLHKGCWHKFKGYAYSQMKNMKDKSPQPCSNRAEDIAQYGYDTKYAAHLVRLLDEVEQILTTGDLELGRNAEQLKAIRRGEVPEEKIYEIFNLKEKCLEQVYQDSKIPWGPDEPAIKQLLIKRIALAHG